MSNRPLGQSGRTKMKQGDFVRIEVESETPHEGYWIVGEVLFDLELGEQLHVLRWIHNGVSAYGSFDTSPVVDVGKGWFRTKNSRYIWNYENPECWPKPAVVGWQALQSDSRRKATSNKKKWRVKAVEKHYIELIVNASSRDEAEAEADEAENHRWRRVIDDWEILEIREVKDDE